MSELEARISELEKQLSDLADDGATAERVSRIEQLLLDAPELQDVYWSWMDTHVLLGVECEALLKREDSRDPLSSRMPSDSQPVVSRADSFRRLFRARPEFWAAAAVLAVSACVVLIAPTLMDTLNRHPAFVQSLPLEHADAALADEAAWQIPQITRVSWEGPFFADATGERATSDPRTGQVTLGLTSGLAAEGYLMRLPPGATAELVMAADATGENSLSVTELDAQGTPLSRRVSFNNVGAGPRPFHANPAAASRRYGAIGMWTESNNSAEPKYYLLTGVHKLADTAMSEPSSQDAWHLSDMSVMIDEPDIIHIGWDDSGPMPLGVGVGYEADSDYDDLSATIRIRRPNHPAAATGTPLRVVGRAATVVGDLKTDADIRYRFTLAPTQIAVLKVASEARVANRVCVIDETTKEVLWGTANVGARTSNLGAVAIENTGDEVRTLALVGEHSEQPKGEDVAWSCSTFKLLHEQPDYVMVGFEDCGQDDSYDDIRVNVLLISNNRHACIESP